ncbi:MAG: radical SAM protein [Clostridiales bacterium]|nr:radical SAM protein [Clostridiales bacterium]
MVRYSEVKEKNPREIILLRGSGCAYGLCTFCDYHLDRCASDDENFALNAEVLSHVTGKYGRIEIINSGSVFELDARTIESIKSTCRQKGITVIHFEAHYMYEDRIDQLRRDFDGFTLKMKLGLETFDYELRERVMRKGIAERDESRIAQNFDEANFLFGITGQTEASMLHDVRSGLKYFERICVNIMCDNTTDVKPDKGVIDIFIRKVYPLYKDDPRVDILIENTDFGVGA